MQTIDPATKRFLALALGPLFLLLKDKLGISVPDEVQELLIVSIIAYIGGSHAKEAVVKRAELAGGAAAAKVVTVEDAAKALADPEAKP